MLKKIDSKISNYSIYFGKIILDYEDIWGGTPIYSSEGYFYEFDETCRPEYYGPYHSQAEAERRANAMYQRIMEL